MILNTEEIVLTLYKYKYDVTCRPCIVVVEVSDMEKKMVIHAHMQPIISGMKLSDNEIITSSADSTIKRWDIRK